MVELFSKSETTLQMLAPTLKVPLALGENTHDVMRLSQGASVCGGLGQLQRLAGELERCGRLALVVQGQTPVGVKPGAQSAGPVVRQGGQGGLKVARRQVPFASPVVNVAEPVLHAGKCAQL